MQCVRYRTYRTLKKQAARFPDKAVVAKLNPKALAKKGNDPVAASAKDGKTVIVNEKVKNPLDGPYLIPGLPPIHPPVVPAISTPSSSDVTLAE